MINNERYQELFTRASAGEPVPDDATDEEKEFYKSFTHNDINKLKFVYGLTQVNLAENSLRKKQEENTIKVFYRLSNLEAFIPKNKIPNATKNRCLENCIKEFGKKNITIIGDRLNNETLEYVKSLKIKFVLVDNGSGAATFRDALNLAIKKNKNTDFVYLLEDDFLHLPGSSKLLKEGIQEFGTYVTLYDHPDKYINANKQYGNPQINMNSEVTRLFKTESVHWKLTNSTVMSFATTVRRLKDDYELLIKYSSNNMTDSYGFFTELIQTKKLSPISSVPGYSTHCVKGWLSPFINWDEL